LKAKIQRLECNNCGAIQQEKLSYAEQKKLYPSNRKIYINDLLECMTIKDIAKNWGMSWNTVKEIQKKYLRKHYGRPEL